MDGCGAIIMDIGIIMNRLFIIIIICIIVDLLIQDGILGTDYQEVFTEVPNDLKKEDYIHSIEEE